MEGVCLDDGSEIFGPGHTWTALYLLTHEEVRMSHWSQDRETVEDAASEGFTRAFTKNGWSDLDASTPALQDRNWNYVKRIARLEARDWFRKERAHSRTEVAVSSLVPEGLTAEQEQDFIDSIYGEAPNGNVAESAVDRDLLERAGRAIEELSNADLGPWFEDLLAGRTVREVEERDQIANQRVSEMRRRGMQSIQHVLQKHGLTKEAH